MKKSLFPLLLILCLSLQDGLAQEPKHEFRATWLATVANIDWPETKATDATTRNQQKKELTDIFDKMVAGNMNAVCMQVRSMCDAMYQSSYEPWSVALTGTRGKDPGYDPLAFAIEEAHKRGLELHVWVNPFRASKGDLANTDLVWKNASDWLIKYNNTSFAGYIIDPGHPEARDYVVKVLMEIVTKYDVDGIVMDDYFYAYGGTTNEDSKAQSLHYNPDNVIDVNGNGNKLDDWRRSNVDDVVKTLYNQIQVSKPWVRFGMGPGGIWSMDKNAAKAYGLTLPSGIRGSDPYTELYCNTVEWIKQGWVDYVNPQIYWSTQVAAQDYDVLCQWWSKDVCEHFSNLLPNGKKVHHFPSPAAYKVYGNYPGYEDGVEEMKREMNANRANLSSGYTGAVFYNTTSYLKMYADLAASHFKHTALAPPMDWKSKTVLSAPTNLTILGTTLTWEHATAERFTLYVYPKNIPFLTAKANPIYLQQVVYGNSFNINGIDTITNNIAVCTYDRFGVEHKAAIYGGHSDSESSPILGTIKWVLNEGEVNTTTVEVPSLAKLEELFKKDYNRYFDASLELNREISNFLYYGSPGNPNNDLEYLVYDMLNAQNSSWTWLRDYILAVSASDATIQAALREGSDTHWRYSLSAFFTSSPSTRLEYAVDFSEYGKQFVWSSMYEIAHGAVLLLTYTTSPYTLPRPTHPEGFTFLGWYDNAAFAGSSLTAIPANWSGTLYAKWDIAPIRWQLNGGIVENIPMPAPTQEQLWAEFKVDANIAMLDSLSTIKKNDRPMNVICGSLLADNVTTVYALSKWSWLKSYIQDVQHAQVGEIIVGIDGTTRTIAELNDDINATNTTSTQWRYSTAAFFVQMQYDQYPATADFSTAGQPSAWGKVYQHTHITDVLPDSVNSTYVLPTPIHPDGYAFLGWSTKKHDIEFISEIDEHFKGILYAIWDEEGGTSTSIEDIKIDFTNTQMYDILGRPVGQNHKGIVIQNGKKYLLK